MVAYLDRYGFHGDMTKLVHICLREDKVTKLKPDTTLASNTRNIEVYDAKMEYVCLLRGTDPYEEYDNHDGETKHMNVFRFKQNKKLLDLEFNKLTLKFLTTKPKKKWIVKVDIHLEAFRDPPPPPPAASGTDGMAMMMMMASMAMSGSGAGDDRGNAHAAQAARFAHMKGDQPPPAAPAPAPAPAPTAAKIKEPAPTTTTTTTTTTAAAAAAPLAPPGAGAAGPLFADVLGSNASASMLSELSQLLDAKLAPVFAKLDALEVKIDRVERAVKDKDSGIGGGGREEEEDNDVLPGLEKVEVVLAESGGGTGTVPPALANDMKSLLSALREEIIL
jgi:hypothetical protein